MFHVIKYVEREEVKDLEDDGTSELLNLKDMINDVQEASDVISKDKVGKKMKNKKNYKKSYRNECCANAGTRHSMAQIVQDIRSNR